MKKTLFAVAALALCGTAFAGEYNARDYEGKDFNYFVFGAKSDVLLHVDKTATLGDFDLWRAKSATLDFAGASTISAEYVDLGVGDDFGGGTLAITGDNDAKNHWGESLTSPAGEVKTLTLVSGVDAMWDFYPPSSATFEGLTESGSITLGDATLTYMGFHEVSAAAEAEALITGDNQIALVAITGTKQLALVGKATSSVPEPATATLSLLALAGMAARRRRK